ncbi:unnamed protein product [Macrosiphum euphorbiae]|uniref:Mutator-like transposase domain-containing protein n=1 Tax=Macrosiphum euphorbiae TaxID=13131 RepID=A0AAV0WU63_9HEMI|nr:unnamed protein product [Macrosiphum euphorbiae]
MFTSENEQDCNYLPINKALVNGSIAIGIGHAQLTELSASADIPFLSTFGYLNNLSSVSQSIKDTALEEI